VRLLAGEMVVTDMWFIGKLPLISFIRELCRMQVGWMREIGPRPSWRRRSQPRQEGRAT
jgi:hypothetical protein